MKLCPREKCPHYSKVIKYPKKCYYEVQCWRGMLDEIFSILKIAWVLKKKKWKIYRVRKTSE